MPIPILKRLFVPRNSETNRHWVLLFITLCIFGICSYVEYWAREDDKDRRNFELNKIAGDIENAIDTFIHPLQGTATLLYMSHLKMTAKEFHTAAAVRDNFSNFHGSLGVGVIKKVPHAKLDEYVRRVRKTNPQFALKRINDKAARPHLDYALIIEMIEPVDKNRKAIGLVISDEKRRLDAALVSIRTGKPAITKQLQLVQSEKKTPGFLLYLPYYSNGKHYATPQEREGHFEAFAYTPITFESIYKAFRIHNPSSPDLIVNEIDEAGLRENILGGALEKSAKFNKSHRKIVDIYNLHWEIALAIPKSALPQIHFNTLVTACLGLLLFVTLIFLEHQATLRDRNQLKNALDFNDAIKASAKFSIITTDLNGLITGFNREAERILGYSADEMVGKNTPAAFHDPNEVVAAAKSLSEECKTEVPVGFETFVFKARRHSFEERQWTYLTKTGGRIPVLLNVTALYDAKNRIYGFMGIAKDISKEVELEESLIQERAKSLHNAKLASLGEMSAGIAHEINNPLAIICGNVSLLQKTKDDPQKFAAKVESISKAALRIEKIVKGLRKFSRTSGTSEFKPESLGTIVSEVLILTEAKSKRHATSITVELGENLIIHCDQVEIEQVLVNLINNAVDAVKNFDERWIKISAFSDKDSIVVRIMNSGVSIPTEVEQKLFLPFFTTKAVGEGTGLGLSIAKGILEEHNASICLNRQFNHTCFEIKFPAVMTNTLKVAA